ncbi:hypothetical protein IWX81_001993 [Salinibacterium sp. CAN_S4]|uniref:hypothetical protein n=1 Tax=Salinibacterium sp. CAN_S4 TaxID=2787727 RepID=UPI0018EF8B42
MPACVSCSTELDPLWKFCVTCGAPVARATELRGEPIPGAIRPEHTVSASPSRTIPPGALIVIVLAVVGVIGVIFAAAAVLR